MTKEFEQEIKDAMSNADLRKDLRQERLRDRAMRSSTFKAIAALEDAPPEEWEQEYLDEVVENVQAVERDRLFERGLWMFVIAVVGLASYLGGWHMKPEPEPEPIEWSCTRTYDDVEVDEINCTGIEF